jgi:hypothetical protein
LVYVCLTNILKYGLQRREIAVDVIDCRDPHNRPSAHENTKRPSMSCQISSRELLAKVDHLAGVMIRMGGAAKEHAEPVGNVLGAYATVRRIPIGLSLCGKCRKNDIDGTVEILKNLVCGPARGVGEFPGPVSNVARSRDLRSYVVVEIASQMQQQVSDRIAVRKRSRPQLLRRKRFDEGVHLPPYAFVVRRQAIRENGQ